MTPEKTCTPQTFLSEGRDFFKKAHLTPFTIPDLRAKILFVVDIFLKEYWRVKRRAVP
jgi:hypothetical protein